MLIWCIVLIICSACRTTDTGIPNPEAVRDLAPLMPPEPVMEQVRFVDRDGGLWLSYEQYRALERNVIALREYAQRLVIIIEFYQEVNDEY